MRPCRTRQFLFSNIFHFPSVISLCLWWLSYHPCWLLLSCLYYIQTALYWSNVFHQMTAVTLWCPRGKCFKHVMKLVIAFHVPFKPFLFSFNTSDGLRSLQKEFLSVQAITNHFIITQWKRLTNEWITHVCFFRNERLIGSLMDVWNLLSHFSSYVYMRWFGMQQ